MKRLKKSDLIILAAFFISMCCLIVTVVMQNGVRKELTLQEIRETTEIISNEALIKTPGTEQTDISENVTDENQTQPDNSGIQQLAHNETTKSNVTTTKAPEKTTAKVHTTEPPTEKCTEIDSVLIVNVNSKVIHSSTCSSALKMKEENKQQISSDELESYLQKGYKVCQMCHCYKE